MVIMEEYPFDTTTKHNNQKGVKACVQRQRLIDEMKTLEEFIASFGYLSIGRDFIVINDWSFSLQHKIKSIELTAGNIVSCCESACLADANILLRKYRDDLFFYLYIIVLVSHKKLSDKNNATKMEENVLRWLKNGLDNLYIQEVLEAIH